MLYEIIIAGFGGQGILSAGRLLVHAGLLEGRNVSWLPSYGPEMRGGTANCHVIISDGPIGSPIIDKADVLIAMTLPALQKFGKVLKPGGMAIVDADMIGEKDVPTDRKTFRLNATSISPNKNYAYMVLIGKLIKETGLVRPDSIEHILHSMLPESKRGMIADEMKILKIGMEDNNGIKTEQ
ncbi:MAG: 2-oxoacid:acceptor oxidoreductase family protein [Clostridia bacterium]